MAEISEKRIQEAVSKALADVRGETERQEAAVFGVGDLRTHLGELARVGEEAAWKISYETSAASVEGGTWSVVDPEVAWKISYETSAASVE